METDDLTPVMQKMLAEMATMRAELNDLKQRANAITKPEQSPYKANKPRVSTTRRNTLKRLGLALLGGVATATALGEASSVQAKIIANPQGNSMVNKVGSLILPPGALPPTGLATNNSTYGLIASGDTAAISLFDLFGGNTGVSGFGTALGIYGLGSATGTGVLGQANTGVVGIGGSTGVSGAGTTGVSGTGDDVNGTGVFGKSARYAGLFDGPVSITGSLSKGGGSFKIDHPLDPENHYLYHSFVESPDMKNIYDGVVVLGEQGEATVTMPDWFEALNTEFRYQLTCLGQPASVYIAEEIQDSKFKIAGGIAGQRVSWMVTGIRQDEWAKAHRIPVEEAKRDAEKGKYLYPKVFGKSEEFKIDLLNNQ